MSDWHRRQGLLWQPLPSALVRLSRDRLALASLVLVTALAIGAAQANASAQVALTGAVDAHWRGAYDLLVRPPGSTTASRATAGLVEPDFLVETTGAKGISLDQLAAIRALPGVAVAAPISVVGYVTSSALAPETDLPDPPPTPTIYDLTLTVTTSDGLHDIVFNRQTATVAVAKGLSFLYTGASTGGSGSSPGPDPSVELQWNFLPPLRTAILGVDPAAEAALLGPRGGFLDPLAHFPAALRGTLTSEAIDCDLDAAAWTVLGVPGCAANSGAAATPLVPVLVADRLPAPLTLHLAVAQVGQPVPRALMAKEVADYSTATLDPLLAAAGPGRTPLGTVTRDVTERITPFGPQDLRTGFPGQPLPSVPPANGSPVDAAAFLVGRPTSRTRACCRASPRRRTWPSRGCPPGAAPTAGSGPPSSSRPWASPDGPATSRPSSRVGSSSGWASPGPSTLIRPSSSWTSRRRTSTGSRPMRSSPSWPALPVRAAASS